MHITILTFDGFNELDSFVPNTILGLAKGAEWKVSIASPNTHVTSMNGVKIEAQATIEDVNKSDAVLIGSGMKTREIAENISLLSTLKLDPSRQLIAAQCSGTYLLVKMGLIRQGLPVCTDLTTKPFLEREGACVIDKPFIAHGNIATAGGCLSAQYLSAWLIARTLGMDAAKKAISYIAPVGEKEEYTMRMVAHVERYL